MLEPFRAICPLNSAIVRILRMSRNVDSISMMVVADNQYGNLFFFTPEPQCIDRCQSHACLRETEPAPRSHHRGIPELADSKSCRGALEGEFSHTW